MKWQEFIKDYLNFSRKERIAVIIIACMILFIFLLPDLLKVITPARNSAIDTTWFTAVRKLQLKSPDTLDRNYQNETEDRYAYSYQYDKTKSSYNEDKNTAGKLFYFDPNTINAEDWKKLGLREKTIQTIQNYLNKGGKFRKPEDLKRIYGLRENDYDRLAPFIKIENATEIKEFSPSTKTDTEYRPEKTFTSGFSIIDVNKSDTTAFISLPGIGSKLAARIVNFRDKLGGFYSIEQVKETFGLPDSTYQKIKQYLKLDTPLVKKININTATVDELKAHPYIKYSLANPIVAYRNEHGPFSILEDIKKVMVITEEIFIKISPYLITQ